MKGEESIQQMRNDHIGLLNRFAVQKDQKVMEPAGGQPTPALPRSCSEIASPFVMNA